MTEAEANFIETMGLISQRSGSPRISGRIFGLLILRGEAVALQDIAETLQVSKASVSTNARLLRDRGMLKLSSHPGERQDYYELQPNPFQGMIAVLSQEMNQAAQDVDGALAGFDTGHPADVRDRIQKLQQFYAHSAGFLADIANNLSKSSPSH